jgi:FixJ family two-component response regulator
VARLDARIVAVVDDDASLRRSLRNLLSSVGLRVATFESAEALLASGEQDAIACLVLDLRMPGMGGLELYRHLVASGWHRPVVVLSGHGDESTRLQCLRAGVLAFLDKPFESDLLLDVVRRAVSATSSADAPADRPATRSASMPASRRPVAFANGTLREHQHVCAFFNGPDEEFRILRSFIRDGIDDGDKAFHIVDPVLREDHLRRLTDVGVDVPGTMSTGQLEVVSWEDAHVRGDRFEQDAMLDLVDSILHEHTEAGYPHTRILAHMEWALADLPGVDDLLEYESRLNAVLPKYDAPVICSYDLSRFGPGVVMDVMRTHPMVIVGGVLQENPFYVPPDELLREIRERKASPRRAGMAR